MAEKKTKGKADRPPTLAERIFDDSIGGYTDIKIIPKKEKPEKDENREVRRVFKGE